MSKLAIVGDVHISARNDNPIIAEYQIKFFEEQLFPYMESHGIDTILQTGDLLDRRKYTNHSIIHLWKKRVFDVMENKKFKMITVLGNHDIVSKNTVEINGPELILGYYSNITIIKSPTELVFDKIPFLFLPWICKDNYAEISNAIEASNASYCFGHFEFSGFEIQKGQIVNEGSSIKPFNKFSAVISGHYHTKSMNENILYTGTPYELTWIDEGDPKGFWVFDTSTQDIEFVRNFNSMFNKIVYCDDGSNDYYKGIPYLHLKDTYVKVYVTNKVDVYGFQKFYDRLISIGVADLKIIEDSPSLDDNDDDEIEIENTVDLLDDVVSKLDTNLDKTKILSILKELHLQAQQTVE